MASKYLLEIVTPDRKFFEGEVEMTIVRTTEGDVGILKDHELLVAPVSIGSIRIRKDGDKFDLAACSGGFLNITEDAVIIVTDAAEWASEIDLQRAIEAQKRAQARLEKKEDQVDVARARISLAKATNRVRVADSKMDHDNL